MYASYYYFCNVVAQHCSMVLWLGLAIFIMVYYIVFMPLLALMFSALMDSSISMLSGVKREWERCREFQTEWVSHHVLGTCWDEHIITQLVWLQSCKSTVFWATICATRVAKRGKDTLENSIIPRSRAWYSSWYFFPVITLLIPT